MNKSVLLGVFLLAGCGSVKEADIEVPIGQEINPVKFKKCLADRLIIDGGQCRLTRLEYAFEQCFNIYSNQCWEEAYEYVYKD